MKNPKPCERHPNAAHTPVCYGCQKQHLQLDAINAADAALLREALAIANPDLMRAIHSVTHYALVGFRREGELLDEIAKLREGKKS